MLWPFFTDCRICDEPHIINKKELFLWGYFQDVNALCSKTLIKTMFDLQNIDLVDYKNKVSRASNPVAISIRCGRDYVSNGYPIIKKEEYYLKAINWIESNRGKSTYFIFSDDLKQAIEILPKGFEYIIVHNESPIIDLLKMSYCNDFIVSNSSFSWWGAYLSDTSAKKLIICPRRWDSYTLTRDSHLLYEGCKVIE